MFCSIQTKPNNIETHGWYDINKDFVLPICVAAIAAFMAYFVFYKGSRADKEKELERQKQNIKDKLTYFAALLSSVIKTTIEQHKNLLDFIDKINRDNVNVPILIYMPIKDLERLAQIDVEAYLLAYAENYADNHSESIKQFKTIMVNTDFLYHIFNELVSQLQKCQQFDYERKIKYQELYYKADKLGGVVYEQLNIRTEWKDRYCALLEKFHNNHLVNKYDVQFYFDYFFVPFNQFYIDLMDSGITISLEIREAAIATRDGKQLFQHIKVENQRLALDFKGDAENIKQSIDELQALANHLLADFGYGST